MSASFGIHNNVLLGIKNVYNSMQDNCASYARSLLCLGHFHQYPVQLCFNLRLLAILDALTIRLYEFPVEVLKLVQLRYLALTLNGKLPASISELFNLQFFIVCRYLSIKPDINEAYLPVEIWNMKELKHLQIMGCHLPVLCGTVLPNLITLLDVSARYFTKGVSERIPNLKKLGIRIELSLDFGENLWSLDSISHLNELESIKCIVVDPVFGSNFVSSLAPLPMFPSSLRKLNLSGMGYPWECTSVIASLKNLRVLKLRNNAFRGPKWAVEENTFLSLEFLIIEGSDLVQWKVGSRSFISLKCLSIKHCYKLQELYWESNTFPKKIELVDCNLLVAVCANNMRETATKEGSSMPFFYVHNSWDDRKEFEDMKLKSYSKGH